jgi:RNA polymerase sigma-70 factor (sigma-E family)
MARRTRATFVGPQVSLVAEVRATVSTERPEFDAFVAARLGALYRYALVLTRDRARAEDLVHDALVRTAAAWWRVRSQDNPEGYVRTVMVRLLVNAHRRPLREDPVGDLPERSVVDPGFAAVDAADEVERRLRELPDRMRAVLVLRYVDGLTEAQIAQRLGISAGTVKSQASRALARLRAAELTGGERDG